MILHEKYTDKETFTRDEVIEYSKELERDKRQSDVLLGKWNERMVYKHEGDMKYNIKHIRWKIVLILLGFVNIVFPIIGGLIYGDFLGLLKGCLITSVVVIGLPILSLIYNGREEIEQTKEDYIENGSR